MLNVGRDESIIAALEAGDPTASVAHRFGLSVSSVNRIYSKHAASRRVGPGRPRGYESEARQQDMVRLIAAGESFADAARNARVEPKTVLRMLQRPDFRSFAAAVLAEPVAA